MRKRSAAGSVLVALVSLSMAASAAAETGAARYSAPPPPPREQLVGGGISLSGGIVPVGGSQAGDDESFGSNWFIAPTYEEAFDTGWLLRAEPFLDFSPTIRGQFGIAHDEWGGKSYNDHSGLPSVKFSDLKMTAFYFGARFRFMPGSRIRPYAVADIGLAHYSAVDVTNFYGPGVKTRYWDSTNTIFGDIGGGAEFHVNPNVAFFVDIRLQGTGKPKSADPPTSDAEGMWTIPVTAGVCFSFGPGRASGDYPPPSAPRGEIAPRQGYAGRGTPAAPTPLPSF